MFHFLKQIVTGNEKQIPYNNVEQKGSWGKWNEQPSTTPKAGLHPKKVMLCIWWDWKGVLYEKLFLENQTINSSKYCSQLDQLKAALNEKGPELVKRKYIIFHQDNAWCMFLWWPGKNLQLGWEGLIHLLCSQDPAPLGVHLFWSLKLQFPGRLLKAPGAVLCLKS